MRRLAVLLALAVALGATTSAQAQILSTLLPNNGSGGVFMELTPSTSDITFNGFATFFASAAGTPVSVEVYTRPGNYAGFTASNAGWTLLETVNGTSAGGASLPANLSAPIFLTNPLNMTAGTTTSVYLHSITVGGGIRYQGTGTTSTSTFMNADLTLFTNVSRTGAVAFAGSQFTPRAFSGDIHYSVVPEPASLITFGLVGGIGFVVRRYRRAKS